MLNSIVRIKNTISNSDKFVVLLLSLQMFSFYIFQPYSFLLLQSLALMTFLLLYRYENTIAQSQMKNKHTKYNIHTQTPRSSLFPPLPLYFVKPGAKAPDHFPFVTAEKVYHSINPAAIDC